MQLHFICNFISMESEDFTVWRKMMPLINCPDCNREVSTAAVSCPSCGSPINVVEPLVIEQTSKVYKQKMILGQFFIIFGILGVFVFPFFMSPIVIILGFFSLVIGLVLFLYGKLAAYWNHG